MESFKVYLTSALPFLLILITCIVLDVHVVREFFKGLKLEPLPSDSSSTITPSSTRPDKVVIGLVSCQKPDSGNYINNEASVMMKSALISAKLYKIPSVDFHIFIENENDQDFFRSKLMEFGGTSDVEVNLYFHDAIKSIPEKYHEIMLFHKQFRCGFIRHFFSTVLPDVDAIIYFDTDVIVTGDIGELWGYLQKMEGEELIGVARNNEPEDTNYNDIHLIGFGDIPLPPKAPKGLNSGMLVMNLTRMRESDYQKRIVRLFEDYSKLVYLEDQKLLNVMLYYDPGLHHLITCQFDIMHTHCDKGLVCPHAPHDPHGIQVIHGAGDQFDEGGSFHNIFRIYQEFDVTKPNETYDDYQDRVIKDLMLPLRHSYRPENEPEKKSECYGILDSLLFKNFFEQIG